MNAATHCIGPDVTLQLTDFSLLDLRRRQITFRDVLTLPAFAVLDLIALPLTAGMMVWSFNDVARGRLVSNAAPALLASVCCLIGLLVLWGEGRRRLRFQRPTGVLFEEWMFGFGCSLVLIVLVSKGTAWPVRHLLMYSFVPLFTGVVIVAIVVPPFYSKYEGLRILERVGHHAQFAQPEYTPATPECPQPELWHMADSQTTELEVLEFLKTLVKTIKPKLVLETGTFLGHGTVKLAEGIRENGFGRVITIEADPAIRANANRRFKELGLSEWIESRLESSLETTIDDTIDLFYSDSHLANREAEIRRLLPQLDPNGLLVIHDASSHFKTVREKRRYD